MAVALKAKFWDFKDAAHAAAARIRVFMDLQRRRAWEKKHPNVAYGNLLVNARFYEPKPLDLRFIRIKPLESDPGKILGEQEPKTPESAAKQA